MGSNSGTTALDGDTLRRRNMKESQQEVEHEDRVRPAQGDQKPTKTIGRTPDGVGAFTTTMERTSVEQKV